MDFVLHNLRLRELVAIVQENRNFYEDFVDFLEQEGYDSILLAFIGDPSDERAASAISRYLNRRADVRLYDGLLRPYSNSRAKWYFLAWLLRDAATQRLQPLLRTMPGDTDIGARLTCSTKSESSSPRFSRNPRVGNGRQYQKLCCQDLKAAVAL